MDVPKRATAADRRLMILYGVTKEEHDRIFEYQGRACFVCRKPPKNVHLGTDHDHARGITRGLLCWSCNKAVAYLADDPDRALRVHTYLTFPPSELALGFRPSARTGRSTRKWRTKREKSERLAWAAAELEKRGYTCRRPR